MLRTNFSVFYSDYTDMQVRIPVQPGQVSVRNAASSEIKGAELEFMFVPSAAVKVEGSLAYLDATYAEFRTAVFDTNPASPTLGQIIGFTDYSGNMLPRAPEWQAYLAAEYSMKHGSSGVTLRAEASYEARMYFSEVNDLTVSRAATQVFNLKAFYDFNEKMRMTAAVDNIGNERYVLGVGVVGGTPLGQIAVPRRWSLELSYRF